MNPGPTAPLAAALSKLGHGAYWGALGCVYKPRLASGAKAPVV